MTETTNSALLDKLATLEQRVESLEVESRLLKLALFQLTVQDLNVLVISEEDDHSEVVKAYESLKESMAIVHGVTDDDRPMGQIPADKEAKSER